MYSQSATIETSAFAEAYMLQTMNKDVNPSAVPPNSCEQPTVIKTLRYPSIIPVTLPIDQNGLILLTPGKTSNFIRVYNWALDPALNVNRYILRYVVPPDEFLYDNYSDSQYISGALEVENNTISTTNYSLSGTFVATRFAEPPNLEMLTYTNLVSYKASEGSVCMQVRASEGIASIVMPPGLTDFESTDEDYYTQSLINGVYDGVTFDTCLVPGNIVRTQAVGTAVPAISSVDISEEVEADFTKYVFSYNQEPQVIPAALGNGWNIPPAAGAMTSFVLFDSLVPSGVGSKVAFRNMFGRLKVQLKVNMGRLDISAQDMPVRAVLVVNAPYIDNTGVVDVGNFETVIADTIVKAGDIALGLYGEVELYTVAEVAQIQVVLQVNPGWNGSTVNTNVSCQLVVSNPGRGWYYAPGSLNALAYTGVSLGTQLVLNGITHHQCIPRAELSRNLIGSYQLFDPEGYEHFKRSLNQLLKMGLKINMPKPMYQRLLRSTMTKELAALVGDSYDNPRIFHAAGAWSRIKDFFVSNLPQLVGGAAGLLTGNPLIGGAVTAGVSGVQRAMSWEDSTPVRRAAGTNLDAVNPMPLSERHRPSPAPSSVVSDIAHALAANEKEKMQNDYAQQQLGEAGLDPPIPESLDKGKESDEVDLVIEVPPKGLSAQTVASPPVISEITDRTYPLGASCLDLPQGSVIHKFTLMPFESYRIAQVHPKAWKDNTLLPDGSYMVQGQVLRKCTSQVNVTLLKNCCRYIYYNGLSLDVFRQYAENPNPTLSQAVGVRHTYMKLVAGSCMDRLVNTVDFAAAVLCSRELVIDHPNWGHPEKGPVPRTALLCSTKYVVKQRSLELRAANIESYLAFRNSGKRNLEDPDPPKSSAVPSVSRSRRRRAAGFDFPIELVAEDATQQFEGKALSLDQARVTIKTRRAAASALRKGAMQGKMAYLRGEFVSILRETIGQAMFPVLSAQGEPMLMAVTVSARPIANDGALTFKKVAGQEIFVAADNKLGDGFMKSVVSGFLVGINGFMVKDVVAANIAQYIQFWDVIDGALTPMPPGDELVDFSAGAATCVAAARALDYERFTDIAFTGGIDVKGGLVTSLVVPEESVAAKSGINTKYLFNLRDHFIASSEGPDRYGRIGIPEIMIEAGYTDLHTSTKKFVFDCSISNLLTVARGVSTEAIKEAGEKLVKKSRGVVTVLPKGHIPTQIDKQAAKALIEAVEDDDVDDETTNEVRAILALIEGSEHAKIGAYKALSASGSSGFDKNLVKQYENFGNTDEVRSVAKKKMLTAFNEKVVPNLQFAMLAYYRALINDDEKAADTAAAGISRKLSFLTSAGKQLANTLVKRERTQAQLGAKKSSESILAQLKGLASTVEFGESAIKEFKQLSADPEAEGSPGYVVWLFSKKQSKKATKIFETLPRKKVMAYLKRHSEVKKKVKAPKVDQKLVAKATSSLKERLKARNATKAKAAEPKKPSLKEVRLSKKKAAAPTPVKKGKAKPVIEEPSEEDEEEEIEEEDEELDEEEELSEEEQELEEEEEEAEEEEAEDEEDDFLAMAAVPKRKHPKLNPPKKTAPAKQGAKKKAPVFDF